jgi:hypothetical protein
MKRIIYFLFIGSVLFSTQSCQTDQCEQIVYTIEHQSFYASVNSLRQNINIKGPRALSIPGKIYFYNDLLLINESYEGIHFIDNSDPSNPVFLQFIEIMGNTDFAIKDGKLYANNQVDLITFDISNLDDIKLESIAEEVFLPEWMEYISNNPDQEHYWYEKPVKTTQVMTCKEFEAAQTVPGGLGRNGGFFVQDDFAVLETSVAFDSNSGSGGTGTAGSMASFIIVGDYLYTLDPNTVFTFDISNSASPEKVNENYVGWGLETIFAHETELYLGSSNGMYILTLEDPADPQYLSSISHVGACDPVYVKDNYAYVTLRSGTLCDGFTNQMDLVDISDKTNPVLVKTFPMTNPHGLSISGDELYLCDGPDGLKVFDISDPFSLSRNLLEEYPDKFAFDVITLPQYDNLMIMIGIQGLVQFDYTNPQNLKELSTIEAVWE